MAERNDRLRRARERVESPSASGQPLSRQELAELVNAWVYDNTTPRRVIATDANYVGQPERGTIRWSQDPDRRAGFRAVLCAATDAELGFRRSRHTRSTVAEVDRQQFIRAALGTSAATVGGPFAFADLIRPTQPTPVPSVVGWAEVAEVRNAAQAFAGWDNRYRGGLLREAVDEEFRHVRPANDDPVYVRYYDAARHAGEIGHALRDVAVHGHFITEARHRLSTAVTGGGEEFARTRVMDQIKLASLVMVTGDPSEAAMIGGQALDVASAIRSRRVADLMRELRRFGEPHKRLAEVAELTHRIGSAVVV